MTELSMEDSWICIDDSSSCSSLVDSDKIDSETEAELYSKIHHETNLTLLDVENLSEKHPGVSVYSINAENVSASIRNISEALSNPNFSNAKRKSSEIDSGYKKSGEKISPAKKFKSNAMYQSVNLNSVDLEDTKHSQQFRMNNLQNKSEAFNSYTHTKSNCGGNTFELDSTDSDNDIWIEPHSNDKNDITINVLKNSETIFLSSSDSENESDISLRFKKRDSALKNLSMPTIKTNGNSKDLWHINYEDLNRSRKYSKRYHDSFDITCSNCNKKGHAYRTCPFSKIIKCFVCGGNNHLGLQCINRMCSNCHSFGHERRKCWKEIYRGFCHLCNMEGHAKGNCPDLWRRYHLSTGPTKLVKGRKDVQDTNLYCWNCGREGHCGAVCPVSHPSRDTFNTWPCVVSYTNPKYFLKSRLYYYGKIPSLNINNSKNFNNVSNASTENKYQLKFNSELSVSSGPNERKRVKKVKKNKLKRSSKAGSMKERDFPRTPKNVNSINGSLSPLIPQEEKISPDSLVKKQFWKLKKRFNKLVKKFGPQSQELVNKNFFPELLLEKSPVNSEFQELDVKLELQKRFNGWRKHRMNLLKKDQNIIKEESLQNHDLHPTNL